MYNLRMHLSRQNRLLKGESFDGRDSYRGAVLRPSVSKSYSFGGYTKGMLSRGDSVTSTHSAGARLMKQGSAAFASLLLFRIPLPPLLCYTDEHDEPLVL